MTLINVIVISAFIGGIILMSEWLMSAFNLIALIAVPIAIATGVAAWWLIVIMVGPIDAEIKEKEEKKRREGKRSN